MEQKLDGLVALLVEPEAATARPSPVAASSASITTGRHTAPPTEDSPHTRPTPSGSSTHHSPALGSRSSGTPHDHLHDLRETHKFDGPPAQHHSSIPTPGPSLHTALIEPSINHDVVKGMLANGRADSLLNDYREMTRFFPFVPISHNTTAQSLSQQKPMLLLAILTTASGKDRALQLTLEEQYRLELASRTIIRPRKTLSMIQSILVYLAW
jgi:hypothetical protein